MLSMTTDYAASTDCPLPYLRQIAEAGFSHIHWCHQWNTDYVYPRDEIEEIAGWLDELGLALTDLHASAGATDHWLSRRQYRRLAGVELVKNRVAMTARLGGDVVILHVPQAPSEQRQREAFGNRLHRSLDALVAYARPRGVRIALENLLPDNFATLRAVFAEYDVAVVGLCYDCGHGNITGGLDRLEGLLDRLISTHLHDNDGRRDQHNLLFSGTVDWGRLAGLIARSPYRKPVSMEVTMGFVERLMPGRFLAKAFRTGTEFSHMIEQAPRQTAPEAGTDQQ